MEELVKELGLQLHPEGGYYRRIFASGHQVSLPAESGIKHRAMSTAIYYLLVHDQISVWHKLLLNDEIWHFYSGSPVKLYTMDSHGQITLYRLGDVMRHPGCQPQVLVSAGMWMAAELEDKTTYALMGCTCFPGFDFADFIMANKQDLIQQFPQHQEIISRLCHA